MTNQQNYSNLKSRSSVHDTVNSLFVLSVYHEHPWNVYGGGQTSLSPHYLKFMNHKGYDGVKSEFNRILMVIEAKVSKRKDNPIKTLVLYQNLSKGGAVKDTANAKLFTVTVKDNTFTNVEMHATNPQNIVQLNKLLNEIQNVLYSY
jgi:hypothetical protein